jgi:hypothetical protein
MSSPFYNEMEREIIRVVRTLTWLELDDLTDSISTTICKFSAFFKVNVNV